MASSEKMPGILVLALLSRRSLLAFLELLQLDDDFLLADLDDLLHHADLLRSEERRVGKECISLWAADDHKNRLIFHGGNLNFPFADLEGAFKLLLADRRFDIPGFI